MKICYNCFNELPDRAKTCPYCGASADLQNGDKYPYALPCGSVLNGKYIVGRVLGQGGFGITYAGQQFDTKKLVAIKEYYPGAIASRNASHSVIPFSKDKSGDYEYGKKQFLDEAKTLAAFIGSPNIVRVYSYFEENGTAYFVMEYVRGTSLRQYVVSRGGRIPWEEAWALLMPVLDALSEVHYRNIIHRDIKPDNIIITKSGSAKLIDFGAARYKHGEKSRSLTAVLTPGYAPPEQYYSSGDQGPWTDVYALAATMYFSITGKNPPESIERAFNDRLESPSALGAGIPAYAEAALLKALSVKEKERYETTYDFRNAVLEGERREKEERGGRDPSSDQNDVIFRDTQKKAVAGDADAQYLLGYFYEKGMGIEPSDEEAVKWYRLAAAQGNTDARMKLNSRQPRDVEAPGARRDRGAAAEQTRPQGSGAANEQSGPQGGGAAAEQTRPQGSNAANEQPRRQGNNADSESPQHRGRKAENGGEKNTGNDKLGGEPPTSGKNTAGAGPQTGPEGQDISKPIPQKNRAADRSGRIILVLGLIALIAFVGSVISRNIGSSSGTGTDGTNQITEESDNTGGQDDPSEQEEEEEEPAQISRPSDAPMELTDTWEEIAAAGHDGTYKDRYRIGDTKELDMGSEGVITMKLVAMDEDELADGSGKAPMTWVADELLKSEHNMNSGETNKGSWEASEMRAWLREAVLPLMPEEVRNNILEVTKYSHSYDEGSDAASRDTIWIPSVREVFPAGYNDYTDERREKEGVTYTSVFTDNASRKRNRDGESGAYWWWLRSASSSASGNFGSVGSDSDSYSAIAGIEGGVVVGFCF